MSFPPSDPPFPAESPVVKSLPPPLMLPGLPPISASPPGPVAVPPAASPPLPTVSVTPVTPPVLPPQPPQVASPPSQVAAPPPQAQALPPPEPPMPPLPAVTPVAPPVLSPTLPKVAPTPAPPPQGQALPPEPPTAMPPVSSPAIPPCPSMAKTPSISPMAPVSLSQPPPSGPPSTSLPPPETASKYPPAFALPVVPTPRPSSSPSSAASPPPLPQLPFADGVLPLSTKHSHLSTSFIVGCLVVAGGVLLLLVLALLWIFCREKKRKVNHTFTSSATKDNYSKGQHSDLPPGAHVITLQTESFPRLNPPPSINTSRDFPLIDSGSGNQFSPKEPYMMTTLCFSGLTFTYDELVVATNGFSESNLIGQGGFGHVHKGVLPSGKEIAVKKQVEGSSQGDCEFQTEVEIISRVHHKHLVSLEGYCISRAERLLVYEFVPNNTLEFHLHGSEQPVMEWETRLRIAIGSGKGLAYLHEDCSPAIIHRDIKAANILLDHNFEAKVSDFGLARRYSGGTGVSTKVVGTFGYLAPEYALSGKVTDKSDVYSYGVMLLELITGRPPISAAQSSMKKGLVEWARPLLIRALGEGDFEPLVDPRLEGSYDRGEMAIMVSCAAACVHHSAWLRPRMSQIARALEGDISAYDLSGGVGTRRTTLGGVSGSSNYNTKDDMNISNMVLAGGLNGYTGSTGEYGFHLSSSSSDDE